MIVYIFDCPVHGEESQVFCFRASDPKLLKRWKRYEVTRTELPLLYDPEALKEVKEIQALLRGKEGWVREGRLLMMATH